MTTNTAPAAVLDDPAEIDRFLAAYRPTGVDLVTWLAVADEAALLVRTAGELKRLRVEKDIQALGAVMAHLTDRGRPNTLDEALADTTLLAYDTELQSAGASTKTRENKRGILRRLQAAHRGLPWRAERRADGARVETMVQPQAASDLQRIVKVAQSASTSVDAAVFLEAVEYARAMRRGGAARPPTSSWERARRFAHEHGLYLTKPILRAIVTHEALGRHAPVVQLIADCQLSRRDLDLALTQVEELPHVPEPIAHAALRGAMRGS